MTKVQNASMRFRSHPSALSDKQRKGRAANAIGELLMHKLLVPKIFLEPKGSKIFLQPKFELNENPWVDVLAIDRAGSGDTHGVLINLNPIQDESHFSDFMRFYMKKAAIHFKYIAVNPSSVAFASGEHLFAEDGIGRIGVIEIKETSSQPPEARIVVPPERFRVEPRWIMEMDRFQKKTAADMEIRD